MQSVKLNLLLTYCVTFPLTAIAGLQSEKLAGIAL
jgi:hypothetical protein